MLEYLELTKPKVTLLNLFVGVTCFVLAKISSISWLGLIVFFGMGYLIAGGCGALNCYYDRNIDKIMSRTSKRVLPSGKVDPTKALLFGTALVLAGLAIAYAAFGTLTLLMASAGAAVYLVVYTLLFKRTNRWNVVIGGVAGSFAALSGWTASSNALSLTPLLIGMLDFLWTPGHLWGLAIKMVEEYKKAKIPMLPVTSGLKKTSQLVFYFNAATVGFSLLFPILSMTGLVYLVIAVIAGIGLFAESYKLLKYFNGEQAFEVFKVSMPYLASILIALIVDRLIPVNIPLLHV